MEGKTAYRNAHKLTRKILKRAESMWETIKYILQESNEKIYSFCTNKNIYS